MVGAIAISFQGTDTFERIFSLKGTVYREQAGRKTLRFSMDGRHYFAKINRGVGRKEIIKNLLGLR